MEKCDLEEWRLQYAARIMRRVARGWAVFDSVQTLRNLPL